MPVESSALVRPVCVGILAIQGAYAAHQRMLAGMGIATKLVRQPQELALVDALILPGGESTTLLHFLQQGEFWAALQEFAQNRPCLGTCAGLILLAQKVLPEQPSLGVLDVTVQRNAYGRQRDSVILQAQTLLPGEKLEMIFIRAPQIVQCSDAVEELAWRDQSPVLVRQGKVIGCAFHPELGSNTRVHQMLLDLIGD